MMKIRLKFPILFVLSALATASLACSLVNRVTNSIDAPEQIEEKIEATQSAVDEEIVPQEEDLPESELEEQSGEDARDIPDVSGDLSGLTSYSMSFSMAYQGTGENGEEKSGSMEMLQEINRGQNASHMRWTSSGGDAEPGSLMGGFERYVLDDVQYMIGLSGDDGDCTSFSSGETDDDMYTTYQPQDWFGDIQDARLIARGEEVNGVVTDHYRFDQNNVNLGTVSAAEGDIWISQDGGYTVKLTARATGSGFFLADMDNGEMTWEYSLSEINQDRQISLPEKCAAQAPSTDIPTPPDANEVSMFAGMTTFTTTDTVEGVSNFYRAELPNQGWEITADQDVYGMISMSATKDDRTLSVTITSDGSTTSVLITETGK